MDLFDNEIKVSIICNVYNHEKYIRDALDGFVMQKTDFAYEVLIHDDASTDRSAEIIREYELKYPDIIKPIYETENQYSKKDGSLGRIQYGRVKGKYCAICEGDDYWTDPLKLQKQYDAMEAHPEIDICSHAAIGVVADTLDFVMNFSPKDETSIIPVEEVIYGGGGYVATNSLFFRYSLLNDRPKFRIMLPMDYTTQIHGSLRGGMLYLHNYMSAYRIMSSGSWTEHMRYNSQEREAFFLKKQEMLKVLNEETNNKYSLTIEKRMVKNEFEFYLSSGKFNEVLQKRYRIFFNELHFAYRIKIILIRFFPWILKLKHCIMKV